MPEPRPSDGRRSARSAAERSSDHAAIDRLATELLPALVAKLGATGLGELEVREGAWRVRLRRPGPVAAASRHAGSGTAPRATAGPAERAARPGRSPIATDPAAPAATVATAPTHGPERRRASRRRRRSASTGRVRDLTVGRPRPRR